MGETTRTTWRIGRVAAVGAVAVTLCVAVAVPGAAGRAAPCGVPAGGHLEVRIGTVIAWTEGTRAAGLTLRACERPRGMVVTVATTSAGPDETLGGFKAAGHFIGYTDDNQIISSQTEGDILSLVVYDVRRRSEVFNEEAGGSSAQACRLDDPTCKGPGPPSTSALIAYVLDARGFAGWVTRADTGASEVFVHDHHGTRRVRHTRAVVKGLRLGAHGLVWLEGGHGRSARVR